MPAPRPRKPAPPDTGIVVPAPSRAKQPHTTPRRLTLPLFDKLNLPRERRLTLRSIPRITAIGYSIPSRIAVRQPPMPGDLIDTRRLLLRLEAVGRALDRLPDEAKRFARWRAARDAAVAQMKEDAIEAGAQRESRAAANPPLRSGGGGRRGRGDAQQPARPRRFRRIGPLRPGRPPGWRRRPSHDVHEILNVTHGLAIWAMEKPDPS